VLITLGITAVLVLVGLVLVLVVWKRRREEQVRQTNYYAFFVMGISFLPAGLALMIVYSATGIPFIVGLPLFAIGLVYLTIGLSNRDKWKKD
jgi:hypothetical protein